MENIQIEKSGNAAVPEVEGTRKPGPDAFGRRINTARPRETLADANVIFRLVAKSAGFNQGANEPFVFFAALIREYAADHQDFLRVQRREVQAGRYTYPRARLNCHAGP